MIKGLCNGVDIIMSTIYGDDGDRCRWQSKSHWLVNLIQGSGFLSGHFFCNDMSLRSCRGKMLSKSCLAEPLWWWWGQTGNVISVMTRHNSEMLLLFQDCLIGVYMSYTVMRRDTKWFIYLYASINIIHARNTHSYTHKLCPKRASKAVIIFQPLYPFSLFFYRCCVHAYWNYNHSRQWICSPNVERHGYILIHYPIWIQYLPPHLPTIHTPHPIHPPPIHTSSSHPHTHPNHQPPHTDTIHTSPIHILPPIHTPSTIPHTHQKHTPSLLIYSTDYVLGLRFKKIKSIHLHINIILIRNPTVSVKVGEIEIENHPWLLLN